MALFRSRGGADAEDPPNERQLLQRALVDLSAERGYLSLSVADLLERAGVDQDAFERDFEDLDDCLALTLEEMRGEFLIAMASSLRGAGSWRDQVRAGAYGLWRFAQADEKRARLMMVEDLSAANRAQLIRDQGLDAMVELVDLGRRELPDPNSLTRRTAEALVAAIYLRISEAIAAGRIATGEQMLPEMMYQVFLPYLGAEVAAEELAIRTPTPPSGPLAGGDLERLEAALVEEVLERGFATATVAGVCGRAGTDRESFKAYFTDIEDGYCKVFEAMRDEIVARVIPPYLSHSDWRQKMRAVAYEMLAWAEEDRRRGYFMFVEGLAAGERALRLRDQGIEAMVELIDAGRQELDDPALVSRATAEAIAGTVYQQIRVVVEREDRITAEMVPGLMYSVVLPYLGVEAAAEELAIAPDKGAFSSPDRTR